jgi:hypothetical protein
MVMDGGTRNEMIQFNTFLQVPKGAKTSAKIPKDVQMKKPAMGYVLYIFLINVRCSIVLKFLFKGSWVGCLESYNDK